MTHNYDGMGTEPEAPCKMNITESMKYLDGQLRGIRYQMDTLFFAMADESFFAERLIDAFGQADAALRRLDFELLRHIRQRENMMGSFALHGNPILPMTTEATGAPAESAE